MFTPRTEPVKKGEEPFAWGVPSEYQCTWFCYGESIRFASPCCWWDRETLTGSYTNAKDWLENYRDPWVVKGTDYTPRQGDIAVFDGEYGHVQFMETDVMFAEYSNGDPNSFRTGKFEKKGNLLGFLHYPYERVETVERNENVNQIETTDEQLRIRTAPSLSAEIVGHVQLGYYNVLQQSEADGYTWYEIAKDRWCANITVNYLPSDETDFVKQLEKFLNDTKAKITALENQNSEMRNDMKKIETIAKGWSK